MINRPFKLLFICTHNRCRSILSEAITNHLGENILEARSAGSQPAGEVHPLSIAYLHDHGIPTKDLKSQSWHDFEHYQADVVITVCDSAAQETCPLWFDSTLVQHWPLLDPSKVQGSEEEIAQAFETAIKTITARTQRLLTVLHSEHTVAALRKFFEPR